ncbi:MAG: metal ABC transporter permease [Hyphomicrobiales bacterium]|nr:MAG: metal ABC transporter permease [Hyphomicrobiales bacterium]
MTLIEFLSDYTLQNVAVGAAILGVVSGVLGSFAVLRQQSLVGDALSHAALPGVCLGFMVAGTRDLGSIMAGALLTGGLAALTILALTRLSRLKTDAAIGISLSVFFALGVVLLTVIQGDGGANQAGLETFLFGQAAAILRSDLWVTGGIAAAALTVVLVLWKEFKLVTFDPTFARTLGLPVTVLEVALTVMVALAVVVGLQMVGVVLMAAMVIAPAVAARQWTRWLEHMVVLSALIGMVSGVMGAVISALGRGLPTGPLIVLAASAIVLISILFAPGRGVVWDALARARERRSLRGRQVLTTLLQLAREHGDPEYPAEQGMLDAYHRLGTRAVLDRLAARGLVTAAAHMPGEGGHWILTPTGQAEAQRLSAEIDRARG